MPSLPRVPLNAASEDDDPAIYLGGMRKVVEARGGIAAVVAENPFVAMKRCNRTLSSRGNPTIRRSRALLKATGLRFGYCQRTMCLKK